MSCCKKKMAHAWRVPKGPDPKLKALRASFKAWNAKKVLDEVEYGLPGARPAVVPLVDPEREARIIALAESCSLIKSEGLMQSLMAYQKVRETVAQMGNMDEWEKKMLHNAIRNQRK